MIERKGPSTQIGTVLKLSGQELIHHWNQLQDGMPRRLRLAITIGVSAASYWTHSNPVLRAAARKLRKSIDA